MKTIPNHADTDFSRYKEYVNNRVPLFDVDAIEENIESIFKKLYLFTEFVEDFNGISLLDPEPNKFIYETKSNLILAFDLLNINYLNVAKLLFRSSIEQFYRFLLSITRIKEYENNISLKVFNSTDSLRDLRSAIDTHKIGKMTNYVKKRFESTPINTYINDLYEYYGHLSKYVHVNDSDIFSEKILLEDYNERDNQGILSFINIFSDLINLYLKILLYLYHTHNLIVSSNLTKRKWLEIEYLIK